MRHLRVETEAELEALTQALEDLAIKPFRGQAMKDARTLLERLQATPDVPETDAPRCTAWRKDVAPSRRCRLTLNADGSCPRGHTRHN